MQIAFYAPMKHLDSPVPSGDREMARNLIRALSMRHRVEVASRFCSRDGAGNLARQQRIVSIGARLGKRLVRRWRSGPAANRPDAWFTYHVYHKAPDVIGPAVSQALGIPYLMAEVSHAPKRAGGPWNTGYQAAEAAIRDADGVIGLSSLDAACVMPLLADPARYHRLAPFTDTAPLAAAAAHRADHRKALCARFGLRPETPLLLAVGMMRDGDKLASYRVLADALARISDRDWTLLIVGDGPARAEIENAFAGLDGGRVIYAGAGAPEELPALYAASDLMVWPAVNEAYGMAMLEAQAAGLPVVAGLTGGVPDVVRDGESGVLCPVGDAPALARTVAELLDDTDRLETMRQRALSLTAAHNDIEAASRHLDEILKTTTKACAA
ncbi:MAG: glycosyltransferase involved in cell wall biosynthesis [Paracoccaceae bacterium]|jgi:glycosyltransferase involved in cell wall biosynthesis